MEKGSEFDEIAREVWERAFSQKAADAVGRYAWVLGLLLRDYVASGPPPEKLLGVVELMRRLPRRLSEGWPRDLDKGMMAGLEVVARLAAMVGEKVASEEERTNLMWALVLLGYLMAPASPGGEHGAAS